MIAGPKNARKPPPSRESRSLGHVVDSRLGKTRKRSPRTHSSRTGDHDAFRITGFAALVNVELG